MLDPFVTLKEAGFSQRPAGAADRLGGWTPELLASLDWIRLSELARALAAEGGCELAGSRVLPDGSVLFAMLERPYTARPQRALVKIAPWNEWGATPQTVERFAKEVSTARDTRGILIAPAGFSTAAIHTAREHRIEAVDAAALHAALRGLPSEKSDFLYVVATAGDCSTPTCPVCQKKLQKVQLQVMSLPSRTIDADGLVAEQIVCDSLVIAEGCEVTFLQEVLACSIEVRGRAEGDFLCQGPVTLHESGTLSGKVAARSLFVRDGGQLLGQFRILEGKVESLVRQVTRWHWACRNADGEDGCAQVQFEPHDSL